MNNNEFFEDTLDKEKIKKLLSNGELSITKVIDAVIELNGIIGVGLISLGDELKDYCTEKIEKDLI